MPGSDKRSKKSKKSAPKSKRAKQPTSQLPPPPSPSPGITLRFRFEPVAGLANASEFVIVDPAGNKILARTIQTNQQWHIFFGTLERLALSRIHTPSPTSKE